MEEALVCVEDRAGRTRAMKSPMQRPAGVDLLRRHRSSDRRRVHPEKPESCSRMRRRAAEARGSLERGLGFSRKRVTRSQSALVRRTASICARAQARAAHSATCDTATRPRPQASGPRNSQLNCFVQHPPRFESTSADPADRNCRPPRWQQSGLTLGRPTVVSASGRCAPCATARGFGVAARSSQRAGRPAARLVVACTTPFACC